LSKFPSAETSDAFESLRIGTGYVSRACGVCHQLAGTGRDLLKSNHSSPNERANPSGMAMGGGPIKFKSEEIYSWHTKR
jgi:hypothetical protein